MTTGIKQWIFITVLNSLPRRHKLRLPSLLYSVCVSQSSRCSVYLTPLCVFQPPSRQSIISEGGTCSSFQENTFSSSQHAHMVWKISILCGSHFHPLAGVWSGDSRQDSSCYTDVRRKKTQYTVTLTIYCSFTAHYYYMIGFIWTVLWICPKKKKDGLWNYKRISPWTFIALLQSFDERLWQSDRSGSAVSIWLITSSVSQYLHPNP